MPSCYDRCTYLNIELISGTFKIINVFVSINWKETPIRFVALLLCWCDRGANMGFQIRPNSFFSALAVTQLTSGD